VQLNAVITAGYNGRSYQADKPGDWKKDSRSFSRLINLSSLSVNTPPTVTYTSDKQTTHPHSDTTELRRLQTLYVMTRKCRLAVTPTQMIFYVSFVP